MENLFQNFSEYLTTISPLAFLVAFLGGIGASLTPCVYPIIPILVGTIGSKAAVAKSRGFTLSLFFVLGMAFTYSLLGLFAALTGTLFGIQSQNPWVAFAVGNICLFFGISMLGVFEISLAGQWGKAAGTKSRNLFDLFFMGASSGLVAAPCTVPVLGVLLAFVATQKNLVFGFSLLFVFALGLGLLLIVLGTFTGLLASLPRSGEWMVRIKKLFGWAMIGVGEYFLLEAGRYGLF